MIKVLMLGVMQFLFLSLEDSLAISVKQYYQIKISHSESTQNQYASGQKHN